MKHLIVVITLLFFCTSGFSQGDLIIEGLSEEAIPSSVKFEGKFKEARRWSDSLGDNLLIISETGVYETPDKYKNAELFAYHFILSGTSELTWKIHDFEKECQLDIEIEFLKNTLSITDLDKNGITEIWLIYKKACRGDVSPSEMKIIMYEGTQKYALRGENKVKFSENEIYGGEYKFDHAFKGAPNKFREFALKIWNNNVLQK